jgi:hypothetical protein
MAVRAAPEAVDIPFLLTFLRPSSFTLIDRPDFYAEEEEPETQQPLPDAENRFNRLKDRLSGLPRDVKDKALLASTYPEQVKRLLLAAGVRVDQDPLIIFTCQTPSPKPARQWYRFGLQWTTQEHPVLTLGPISSVRITLDTEGRFPNITADNGYFYAEAWDRNGTRVTAPTSRDPYLGNPLIVDAFGWRSSRRVEAIAEPYNWTRQLALTEQLVDVAMLGVS